MVCIGQDHLDAEVPKRFGAHALDGRFRADRNERRRLDGAMGGRESSDARPRGAGGRGQNFPRKAVGRRHLKSSAAGEIANDESNGKQQTPNNNDQNAAEPRPWALQFVVCRLIRHSDFVIRHFIQYARTNWTPG
jgi:hypothetical protein